MTKKAFENIYLRFYAELKVYGRSISTDQSLIEDVIQELFLDLWKKQPSTDTILQLDTYLYTSFRNNLLRKLKQQGKLRALTTYHTAFITRPSVHPDVIAKEEQVKNLVAQLPPRQREVLFLRYYKNKSYQEISTILGINYQVARNFAYRAIQVMRKKYKDAYTLRLILFTLILPNLF